MSFEHTERNPSTNGSTEQKSHSKIKIPRLIPDSMYRSFQSKVNCLEVRKYPEMLRDVGALYSLWQQISDFAKNSTHEDVRDYFETLCEKTKELTMHEDWMKVVPPIRNHLVTLAFNARENIFENTAFSLGTKKIIWELIIIAVEPWRNPLILNLLRKDCYLDAVDDYLSLEREETTLYRLRLILSRVNEYHHFVMVSYFTGNMLKACERDEKIEIILTTDGLNYIVDAYLVALFNASKTVDQMTYIGRMSFENFRNLHRRYMTYGIGILRSDAEKIFWQHSERVINMVNRYVLWRILGLDLSESKNFEILKEVLPICIEREDLTCNKYQRFIWCALTHYEKSYNLRQFNKLFIKKVQNLENLKSFCVTLIIKELLAAINELEHYKFTSNKELADLTRRFLSESYLFVCEYFNDVRIRKEAILGAFNVNPTVSNYQKVIAIATVMKFKEPSGDSNGNRCCVSIGKVRGHSYETRSGDARREFLRNVRRELERNLNETPGGYSYENLFKDSVGLEVLNEERRERSLSGRNKEDSNVKPSGDSREMFERNSIGEPGEDSSENCEGHSFGNYIAVADFDESLLRDLSMALNYNRHHSLKWSMDWDTLEMNCMEYMEKFETMIAEKELKYLRK